MSGARAGGEARVVSMTASTSGGFALHLPCSLGGIITFWERTFIRLKSLVWRGHRLIALLAALLAAWLAALLV